MIDESKIVQVKDDVFVSLAAVGGRQALIAASSAVLVRAVGIDLYPGVVEAVGAGVLLAVTIGYGQWKAYRDKRTAVALATTAPNGEVADSSFKVAAAKVRSMVQ